ncbi:MAG: Phosphate-specific transport system accessory protein PhoU-like protein 2 [Frankiales bacterium]|nr:Phosphate-specific transport system accessory protein PhoU-like protein 2 [Frankiales bacterium]
MRASYHEQLAEVGDGLIEMSRLVGSAVSKATTALLDADLSAAETVIEQDEEVNKLYRQLDDVAVQLLARQQPVAIDLRAIVTALRMSSDLERVGDYAVHIAKVAKRRHPATVVPVELRATILEMGQAATRIAIKAGTVIATRDLTLAAQLLADDDTIDELHAELFEKLLSENFEHGVEAAIDLALLGRYYERLADHAVSVSHAVTYLVTGEHSDPESYAADA